MHIVRVALLVTLAVIAADATPVNAQGIPGLDSNKCLAGKTKCVNKKTVGLFKCRAKCQKSPARCGAVEDACEAKIRGKFDGIDAATSCFGKVEAKQNPSAPETVCTTTNDSPSLEATIDAVVGDLVATLEGQPPGTCGDGAATGAESCDGADLGGATCESLGYSSGSLACTSGCGYDVSGCVAYPPPGSCTNGTIEPPESCDGTNLGGATCATLGYAGGSLGCTAFCGYDVSSCVCASAAYPATGQTTCWDSAGNVVPCAGTGHDGDLQAGAPLAYRDNGDGTISDLNTGLMWEKMSDDGSVHDQDNYYSWDNAFAGHVAMLNGGSFAGHGDWRVPNLRELASLVNLELYAPAISSAFDTGCTPGCTVATCSCTEHFTSNNQFWSSTTDPNNRKVASFVEFADGYVFGYFKSGGKHVRAVRGGA